MSNPINVYICLPIVKVVCNLMVSCISQWSEMFFSGIPQYPKVPFFIAGADFTVFLHAFITSNAPYPGPITDATQTPTSEEWSFLLPDQGGSAGAHTLQRCSTLHNGY